jgi:HEAT repeat protein
VPLPGLCRHEALCSLYQFCLSIPRRPRLPAAPRSSRSLGDPPRLLYAWDDRATPSIIKATRDGAWRVREMALKVIARHKIGEAIDAVARLQHDPVARVRTAAQRALVMLTAARA